MLDGIEFGNEVVALVRGYVEREIGPLKAENADLKARIAAIETRPSPEKGEAGERGVDGVSPEPEAVAAALLPIAEELITAEVAKAVAELPPSERGEKGEQGEPGKDGSHGLDGAPGRDGSDGRGIKSLLIDRDGELVAMMDDGDLKKLGPVVGRDGKNAETEEWDSALTDEQKAGLFAAMLRKELGDEELIPLPDPVPAQQSQNAPQLVVHNHLPKRGVEKTVVTKHDERGRIVEYERREV